MNQRDRSRISAWGVVTPRPSNDITIRPGRTLPPMLVIRSVGPFQAAMTMGVSPPAPGAPSRSR